MEVNAKSSRSKIYVLAMTAVMAAVIAAVAPFSIPGWGEVSFTLCTFVLYLRPYFHGRYHLGYIPMVIIGGLIIKAFPKNRAIHLGGMILATAVLYTFGSVMFCAIMGATPEVALLKCVLPFIPFDLGKMVVATGLGPVLRERLVQANIHPEG